MNPIGVITGLASESALLDRFAANERPAVRCAGASSERAREAARALLGEGCGGLLSFGVAGGLDPALAPGTVVIASEVVTADGRRFAADDVWRRALGDAIRRAVGAVDATLAGSDVVVTTPSGKRRLLADTGAVAVDMESHAAAEVAAAANVPFLALRAVCDPADGTVPTAALKGVGADGRLRPWAVAGGLLARPGELWGLIRLGRHTRLALASLGRVALVAGPRFGFE